MHSVVFKIMDLATQWNHSNVDTMGSSPCVQNIEASVFQKLQGIFPVGVAMDTHAVEH